MRGFALVALVSLLVSPVSAAQSKESCDATGEVSDVDGEDSSLTLKTTDGEKHFKVDINRVRDWQDLEDGERISVRCYEHPQNGPTITAISKVG